MTVSHSRRVRALTEAWLKLTSLCLSQRDSQSNDAFFSRAQIEGLVATAGVASSDRVSAVRAIIEHPRTETGANDAYRFSGGVFDPVHFLLAATDSVIKPARAGPWFVKCLREKFKVRGSQASWGLIRAMCRGLDELSRAERTPPSILHAEDFDRLASGAPDISSEEVGKTRDLLINWLLAKRTILPKGEKPVGFELRGSINSEYVLNCLFDAGFSVRGLDLLVEGGLRLSDDYGHSLLVRANPGLGKTTLALQCASDNAALGGISFYFTAEQDYNRIIGLLDKFGFHDNEWFNVVKPSRYEEGKLTQFAEDGKGVLVFSRLPRTSYEVAQKSIRKVLSELPADNPPRLLTVVDSVNAIWDYDERGGSIRPDVHEFAEGMTHGGNILLLVEENHERGQKAKPTFEEYVLDTIVDLSASDVLARDVEAVIRISKCREQRQRDGYHALSIGSDLSRGPGVRVYPLPSAVITARRGRRPSKVGEVLRTRIAGLERRLFSTDESDTKHPLGFRENSVIGILGPPGTHKSALARGIMLAEHQGERAAFARLSFREHQRRHESLHEDYSFVERLVAERKEEGLDSIEPSELAFFPGLLAAGVVLERLMTELKHAKDRGVPITRILIDDMGLLPTAYPHLVSAPLWIPALFQILRTENLTACVVGSIPGGQTQGENWLVENIAGELDYFVSTSVARVVGRQLTAVTLEKSPYPWIKGGLSELRLTSDGVELADRLDAYHVDAQGDVSPVTANIYLPIETRSQWEYTRVAETLLQQAMIEATSIHPISEEMVHVESLKLGVRPLADLRVVALDEFWIGEFKRDLLYPIRRSGGSEVVESYPDVISQRMLGPGGKVIAVPYQLNFGLLCYRNDLIGADEVPATWENVRDIAWREIDKGEGNVKRGLAIPAGMKENLNCLFLEILANKGLLKCGDCLVDAIQKEGILEACVLLSQLLVVRNGGDCRREATVAVKTPDDVAFVRSAGNSVFWREWFSTVSQLYDDHPDSRASISFAPLPGDISVSGEWYLGVLKGSLSLGSGCRLVEELCSEHQCMERMARGAGLSPLVKDYARDAVVPFGDDVVETNIVANYLDKQIQRSDYRCYRRISRVLLSFLVSMTKLSWRDGLGDSDCRDKVKRRLHGMQSFMRKGCSECAACEGNGDA